MSRQSHAFNVEHAELYGIECAILISHFQFWIDQNRVLGRNFHDGRTWTYQTQKEIAAVYTYWNRDKVQDILKKLVEFGVIIKGNYNKLKLDKTQWYAFNNEKMFTNVQNGTQQKSKPHNDVCETAQPIPDTNTNTKNKLREKTLPLDSFGSHVKLSKDQYSKLCQTHTKEKTDLFIEKINDYCEAHGESYQGYAAAIRNWIRKEKDFVSKNSNRGISDVSKEENMKICREYEKVITSPNFTLEILTQHVEIVPKLNGQPICIKYSELGFKEQFTNSLRKCGFTKKQGELR